MVEQMIAATDGAATPNPGPTGWAWVLADGQEAPLRGESGFLGHATNNVGELTAVEQLLIATDPAVPMEIRVDSQYVRGVATGHHRAAKNQELVARIKELLSVRDVTFTWVRAHQADGDALNAIADHTANQAVDGCQGHSWTGIAPRPIPRPETPAARPRLAAPTPANGATASHSQCRATTKDGRRCAIESRPSGLCHLHDPAVQCQATTHSGRRCAMATGGGRCKHHRSQLV